MLLLHNLNWDYKGDQDRNPSTHIHYIKEKKLEILSGCHDLKKKKKSLSAVNAIWYPRMETGRKGQEWMN